jgi:glucosamine--fructose-6-phosphate aminotransferase (isomerizing)
MSTSIKTTMYSEIQEFPRIIVESLARLKEIDQIAAILKSKDFATVQVLGRGTSGNASLFLKYLIEVKLGILVADASPSTTSIYNSPIAMRNNLLIGMSQSGKSTDLVEFARTAIESGAYFVAMTNDASSPLAQLAHHHIELRVGPELAVAATKSYSSELLHAQLLVDAILAGNTPSQLAEEALRVIEDSDVRIQGATPLHHAQDIVVLGRGYSLANALELSLKIKETSLINVPANSTAEYLHGPIAALKESSSVIFLAPSGQDYSVIEPTVKRVRAITKNIYWIGSAQFCAEGETYLGGSSITDESYSCILDSTVLQLLANQLAVAKGLNPDAPKGLNKVTLTL